MSARSILHPSSVLRYAGRRTLECRAPKASSSLASTTQMLLRGEEGEASRGAGVVVLDDPPACTARRRRRRRRVDRVSAEGVRVDGRRLCRCSVRPVRYEKMLSIPAQARSMSYSIRSPADTSTQGPSSPSRRRRRCRGQRRRCLLCYVRGLSP